MTKFVLFEKVGEGNCPNFKVTYENGVYMGDLSIAHDCNYNFWPDLKGGFWAGYVLKEIVDKLEELNKPINDEMNEYFDKQAAAQEQSNREMHIADSC